MAEQNKDKLNIRLHVYDEDISVSINREDEEYYRLAAKLVTDRYNAYAGVFKGHKPDHTVALMTLIDVALMYEKQRANTDTTPYDNVLTRLTSEIEDALDERKSEKREH